MKKIYLASLAALFGMAFVFTSCDNDDTTAPIITINGNAVEFVDIGDAWTDMGATASDDEDGTIDPSLITTTGTVETDSVNTYVITYSVSDNAGNPASADRFVNVQLWQGSVYTSNHVCTSGTFPLTNEAVNNLSSVNEIEITNFAGFSGVTINADVQGRSITITTTSFVFNSNTFTLKGTGTITPSSDKFTLDYTIDEGLATEDICSAEYQK